MTRLTIGLGFVAVIAASISAPVASAASTPAVVPPENSAAAQYTEAVPTAGGDKPTGGGKTGHRSPAKVLGSHNANKLEAQGKSGREVAEVVAATAPETKPGGAQTTVGRSTAPTPGVAGAAQRSKSPKASRHGRASRRGVHSGPAPQEVRVTAPSELPNGSSGFGEVLAEATGSSSGGQLGALLPLAISASIAWSLASLWRRRRRTG
ncbi:MAG: hypothetical protein ACRDQZ_06470 [Mycobacteriales bacterium]